ncbi:MAG: T9SS type A sorting domain-containing protein [Bacteroidota bacterium]
MRLILALGVLLFASFSYGQTVELTRWQPVVTQNGVSSFLGFAGGLNSPQFSIVDLNRDGRYDFFLFDRSGDVPMAYTRVGDGSFRLRNDWLQHFPPLEDWVLLRDYNQDGAMDIFCYNDFAASGVQIWRGYYGSDNLLHFDRVTFDNELDIPFFATPSGGETQIYISDIDYPAIQDIDCDGDLDILTFNIGGGFIEFFKNQSIENGHGLDSLQFTLEDDCYGGIYEAGISEFLTLSAGPGECAGGGPDPLDDEVDNRHIGSTLLLFDNDGDNDMDLVLGDLSFPYLNLSTNANGCAQAWMNEQDAYFPSYDITAELPIFPAAYYLDINNDGIRDLIAAPNLTSNGVDHENVWYYVNNGADNNPDFNLEQRDLLVGEMIDLGTRSHPALLDYDADGLMDIVVGNQSFYELFGVKNTRLYLYRNVGTPTVPAFELVDDDFMDMNQFSQGLDFVGTFGLAPTFGDLDGDGDLDAVIGDIDGKLFFAENTAGPNQPVNFQTAVYEWQDIDVGKSATPQIIDLNRDGLPDLVIGEKNGNLNYFQNQGTSGTPVFVADEEASPNQRRLGDVDTRIPGFSTGYSAPWFVDFNGEYQLYVATQFGTVEVYTDIDGNLGDESTFTRIEDVAVVSEGAHLQIRMHDWNGDGLYEFLFGNERGGLSMLSSTLTVDGVVDTDEVLASSPALRLYPNPTREQIWVEIPAARPTTLQLFNLQGQLVLETMTDRQRESIELTHLPTGTYFLIVQQDGQRLVERVVKQ